jgi:hypothetical protein
MAITATENTNLHWNYFIALEQDLEHLSRYIEFCTPNLGVYSIELAHLLFAAASEVDVLAKCICKQVAPPEPREKITHYRAVLTNASNIPDTFKPLSETEIFVPRYGLRFTPWENWAQASNPNPYWWSGYNQVKHERNEHFEKANLLNALNAMGALLIMNVFYYRLKFCPDLTRCYPPKSVTSQLQPETVLLRLPDQYYLATYLKNTFG